MAIETPAPLGKATAATRAYERLRRDIVTGRLAPGRKLGIDFLSERYGAGAIPIREALNRLASDGLVTRHDQRGFFVATVGIDDWRELVMTRCWAESQALEVSIANRDQAWEESIVLAAHRLSRTPFTLSEDLFDLNPDWEARHREFHMALLSRCGSSYLLRFCEDLMNKAERYRYLADSKVYASRRRDDEHRGIMDAAIDGDGDRAVTLLREHYSLSLAVAERAVPEFLGIARQPAS